MARVLEFDPVLAIKRLFHFDHTTDETVIENKQDVTQIIELNKASYAAHDERTPYGDMSRVASIPMNVYMDLVAKGIAQDEAAFKRWLDDADQRAFRTRPGKLSR